LAAALETALGVTRVARVTGLDRAGVEVACAIRPGGHVLQVSNGKGDSWEEARATALSEAAELWAAERVTASELVFGSQRELGALAWTPAPLVAERLWSRDTRIAWRRGQDLASGREVLVPAQAVHCPPRGSPPLGPAVVRWSSNGLGAHPVRARAVQHALLEVCERDRLARVLPHGWTPRAIRTRKVDVSRLPLWQQLRDARLLAHVFDLRPGLGFGPGGALPVVGAILFDLEEGPVPVTAGYCCAPTAARAVRRALLEAAQSRLTEVHGAREDVAQGREEQRGLREACEAARPSKTLRELQVNSVHLKKVNGVHSFRAAVVELAREPIFVVKVYAPGMRLSELL
jgi:ribosomal protein S12 methylthiotransferase accessory factor